MYWFRQSEYSDSITVNVTMEETEKLDVINDFFRDKPLPAKELEDLRNSYKSEWAKLNSGRGCSRCKKNAVRKKYSTKIKEILGRENK